VNAKEQRDASRTRMTFDPDDPFYIKDLQRPAVIKVFEWLDEDLLTLWYVFRKICLKWNEGREFNNCWNRRVSVENWKMYDFGEDQLL